MSNISNTSNTSDEIYAVLERACYRWYTESGIGGRGLEDYFFPATIDGEGEFNLNGYSLDLLADTNGNSVYLRIDITTDDNDLYFELEGLVKSYRDKWKDLLEDEFKSDFFKFEIKLYGER